MSNLILIGIIVFIAIWVYIGYEFYRAPLIPDDYDEDHALDLVINDMVKDFTEDDIEAIIEANENPQEPNTKLKEAAKLYKDANKEDKRGI